MPRIAVPIALAALAFASALPTTRPMPIGSETLTILERLHETSASTKTRRSLELHAELRKTCTLGGHVLREADKLMQQYRANPIKFHRQASDDWNELLIAARARCGRVAVENQRIAHATSTTRTPYLSDGSRSGPESQANRRSSGSLPCDKYMREARPYSAARSPRAFAGMSIQHVESSELHAVEAQLRVILQQAVADHTEDAASRYR